MCFKRRLQHICGHESNEEDMCDEAKVTNRLGECTEGLKDQSESPMPAEGRSFCSECQRGIDEYGTRPRPTPEQRAAAKCARDKIVEDCQAELRAALAMSNDDELEKKKSLGDAAFNLSFYRERGLWQTKVEELEDTFLNDAENLKRGKEELLHEFEKCTEDLWNDFGSFYEDIAALLKKYGYDEAYFIDRDPRNH
ncbi:hypothetical protein MFRU_005g02810 [Monilinia fructicola]|uniref:Uncharacterized protein n=1 Tax=Monilinia fructicola TaxID=38448 RepID=A0A5M9JQQ0_MONFR|nr:hypothetical protein EYC84_002476 [Monilinia fructicola]KAG4033268.1 hypothetical protein MFRU_005g02810 [Monilinia fructicola]